MLEEIKYRISKQTNIADSSFEYFDVGRETQTIAVTGQLNLNLKP